MNTCTECQGTGQYTGLNHVEKCQNCQGTGTKPPGTHIYRWGIHWDAAAISYLTAEFMIDWTTKAQRPPHSPNQQSP